MKSGQVTLQVSGVTRVLGKHRVLDNINFTVCVGECWALVGPSGSGKTELARALAGKGFVQGSISYDLPDKFGDQPRIAFIEQQHQFRNLSNTDSFYYQQRFNSFDSEDSHTVKQYLETTGFTDLGLLEKWGLAAMLDKPLIQLSNGENKRLQLVQALTTNPAVLILDNPFTGLDIQGRNTLEQLLATAMQQQVLVIVVARAGELPLAVSHLLALENGKAVYSGPVDGFAWPRPPARVKADLATSILANTTSTAPLSIIKMEDVSVRYGDQVILDKINWEVNRGERWSISGPNGAGKSTLLSLVTGDNPQAYSNRIWLFDRRRGSGETIWDIKSRIGYVSPELHLSFDRGSTAFDVVASGFFDTVGLFRRPDEVQEERVNAVLEVFGLHEGSNKLFHQFSIGQQRLMLLARALVKSPPLLILDEPCQGLDNEQSDWLKEMVNQVCEASDTTLVYISHYVSDIPACVTKKLQLENGRINTA